MEIPLAREKAAFESVLESALGRSVRVEVHDVRAERDLGDGRVHPGGCESSLLSCTDTPKDL